MQSDLIYMYTHIDALRNICRCIISACDFVAGARRFVVLDFGKPILLTDVVIPACGDLASLSIDVWIRGEETDGHRLIVSTDIGMRSLIMNDLMPPPLCRYLKV